jgi:hypothetical protein
MLRALLRFLFGPADTSGEAGARGVWPNTHRSLAAEAAALCRAEPAGTQIVLMAASYLPHGGRDRVRLVLRVDGGRIERTRTPMRREPISAARQLEADEAARLRAALDARGVWSLVDQCEPIMDGLVAGFAFAEGERVHSIQLHCGTRDSELAQLLKWLCWLAPLD